MKIVFILGDTSWYNKTDDSSATKWWSSYGDCPLLNMDSDIDKFRLVTEIIQLAGAFLYIVAALREMKFLGYHMFIENLVKLQKNQNKKCNDERIFFPINSR